MKPELNWVWMTPTRPLDTRGWFVALGMAPGAAGMGEQAKRSELQVEATAADSGVLARSQTPDCVGLGRPAQCP